MLLIINLRHSKNQCINVQPREVVRLTERIATHKNQFHHCNGAYIFRYFELKKWLKNSEERDEKQDSSDKHHIAVTEQTVLTDQ